MRIVFVVPHADMSGGVRTVATHAAMLARRGHAVTVVSMPRPSPSLRARAGSLARGRGWPRTIRREPSHLDGAPIEHRRLDRYGPLTEGDVPDADVIVATWWLTAEWVAALSPRKGAKVHFVQGDDADLPGQPAARVAATWRLPFHRIVCSRWLLELARDRHGVEATLVPNGVDLALFDAPPREKQRHPTVGVVYSSLPIKGVDVALAAIERAARRFHDLRLVSFASAPPSPALPLPPRCRFTLHPPQAEIPSLYASCDAWLWPSRREGFGLPILEAMACRTPVIAAPAGAAPDLLEAGGGILLSACEPGPMADAIDRILGLPPPEWRRLSEEARAVAERHGWERSGDLFEAALAAAADRGTLPHRAGPG